MSAFPKMLRVRQKFPRPAPLDIEAELHAQFSVSKLLSGLKPGARVAITAGSRGITNFARLVRGVVDQVKAAGCAPFIVPAMGSHGGATAEGQTGILADYGITEKSMGAPIRASMETKVLGYTADGVAVHFSVAALDSDGIIAVNRVKPHTDFNGVKIASGLMKMIGIGLSKRNGAEACHAAATRLGHESVILSAARISLAHAPILGGVGVVENQFHETALLRVTAKAGLEETDSLLLQEARKRMPALPFADVDLLIIDAIGKNISGTGMDTNIIGRGVQGYSSSLIPGEIKPPIVRRLFVRNLTPQTHGNAAGVGLADFVTTRLVNAIDKKTTYINSLTAVTPQLAKIPVHFDSDREVLEKAIATLALGADERVKCIRIADTLSLEELWVSEAYADALKTRDDVEILSAPVDFTFDEMGNLTD